MYTDVYFVIPPVTTPSINGSQAKVYKKLRPFKVTAVFVPETPLEMNDVLCEVPKPY